VEEADTDDIAAGIPYFVTTMVSGREWNGERMLSLATSVIG